MSPTPNTAETRPTEIGNTETCNTKTRNAETDTAYTATADATISALLAETPPHEDPYDNDVLVDESVTPSTNTQRQSSTTQSTERQSTERRPLQSRSLFRRTRRQLQQYRHRIALYIQCCVQYHELREAMCDWVPLTTAAMTALDTFDALDDTYPHYDALPGNPLPGSPLHADTLLQSRLFDWYQPDDLSHRDLLLAYISQPDMLQLKNLRPDRLHKHLRDMHAVITLRTRGEIADAEDIGQAGHALIMHTRSVLTTRGLGVQHATTTAPTTAAIFDAAMVDYLVQRHHAPCSEHARLIWVTNTVLPALRRAAMRDVTNNDQLALTLRAKIESPVHQSLHNGDFDAGAYAELYADAASRMRDARKHGGENRNSAEL